MDVKRKTRSPADDQNWELRCKHCGEAFPDMAEMGMVKAHMEIVHELETVELELTWVGLGPPPKARL